MMSLQFIFGGSGSGKSTYLYDMISREAAEHREKKYLVLVPDQFTLETQKTLVQRSGKSGILNVDVLSFHRLAYRVFEEVPALRKTVLEDTGKMMLLRKVISEQKKNLKYFRRGLYKPGFLDECKSFMCELMQYAISDEDFERMEEMLPGETLMAWKLQDIRLIYRALKEKMGDVYMMSEELVPQLTSVAASIPMLQDSVICLDGFTGFTPTQYELLRELLRVSERMIVTVTTDRTEKRTSVFSMSKEMIKKMTDIARAVSVGIDEPVMTGWGKEKIPYRLKENGELSFLEKNIFSYRCEKWEEKSEHIQLRLCQKESGESAYVAREIARLVRNEGYHYGEIAVVTGDLASYESSLAREMKRMGIRYFMDYKKSIGANAMAEYVMAFLAMVRKNMDRESTFRFLRCGLSPLTTEETDILENYVMARGRRGYKTYQKEWEYEVKQIDLVAVNEYREKFVASIQRAFEALKEGKKTVRKFGEILYQLIVDNHLYERVMEKSEKFEEMGEMIFAHEYKSIYRLMMELLNEMVELLGDEVVTFREFEEMIGAGISEGLVGFVPPTTNQVMVGDVERSRLKNIKVLFFMGVSDDRIPKKKGTAGLLSESERGRLAAQGIELAPLPEKQAETEQFYLYLTLTKPSDKLYLTCARMGDDGSSKRPSYLISKIRGLFSELKWVEDEKEESLEKVLGTDRGKTYFVSHFADRSFQKDALWWELAAYYRRERPEFIENLIAAREEGKEKSKISKEAAALLYGDVLSGSVSSLETFVACPYKYFVRYGLGLRERENFDIEDMDYGNVFHKSMEHFSHIIEDQRKAWNDLTQEEVKIAAENAVDAAVEDYKGKLFFQSQRSEFVVSRVKRIVWRAAWGIWRQMKEGAFVQRDSERAFFRDVSLDDEKKMLLRGVIDRIDVCESEDGALIKIVDYKKSNLDIALDRIYYGLQLQLLTYLRVTMEQEKGKAIPAAMLYYQIKEPLIAWEEESNTKRELRELEEFRCGGYVNEKPEILETLDKEIAERGMLKQRVASKVVPVRTDKNGEFSKKSHVLSSEQFEELMAHADKKMREFGNQIYGGEIGARPYRLEDKNACENCGMKGLCGMENRYVKNREREFKKMIDEEVWEVLHERDQVDGKTEENH